LARRAFSHGRSNGHLANDGDGRLCADNRAAYTHAIKGTPLLLGKFLQATKPRVHTRDDPRHIGRVEAIHHGAYARVRWDETWRSSEVPIGDLVNLSRWVRR
jgi:hypothetical protein